MKTIFRTLTASLLLVTLLSGCEQRVSHSSTGEKVYGGITLLTESLYEAVEGKNGLGRGAKVNYQNMRYDAQGLLVETEHYWKHQVMQRELFSYDAEGRLAGGEVYGFEGALLGNYSYTLGPDGRPTEQVLTSKEGKVLWKSNFTYDAQGNLMERITYDTDGSVMGSTKVSFNEKGFPMATESFGTNSTPDRKLTHTYEGEDSEGNWIRRINYSDGKVVSLVEREIIY